MYEHVIDKLFKKEIIINIIIKIVSTHRREMILTPA